jgi:parallel beta-helix repeat protein
VELLRKTVSGIMLTLLLLSMLALAFNIRSVKTDHSVQLILETDKNVYFLGENVTITLINVGDETVEIGGYPAWQIFTYPEEDPVYPKFFAFLAWSLDPEEYDTFTWNQYNQINESFCGPGTYVVRDTQGWSLSAYFKIIAAEITVPDDHPTIQEAINAANDGDTIFVRNGTYYENVVVNKPVSVVGENGIITTIDGNGTGNVLTVSTDYVNISGFTIKGSGTNYISPFDGGDSGIELDGVTNCAISDCIIIENCLGIFLNLSDHNILENNICHSNSKDGIYLRLSNNNIIDANICNLNGGHAGIYLNPSNSNNLIMNNLCDSNADHGIKLQEFSNNNLLKNNTCTNNWNAGIFLRSSNNNMLNSNICYANKNNPGIILHYHNNNNNLINNICNSNDGGIGLQLSSNNNMLINNTCLENRGSGIGIDGSANNNTITGNTCSLNGEDPHGTAGIYFEDSSYNNIFNNTISMNWRGIFIMGENSTGYTINQNNIERNVEWGLMNEAPTEVNATLNWWGSPYGPEVCQFVEETDAEDPEEIRGNISYEPWLTEPNKFVKSFSDIAITNISLYRTVVSNKTLTSINVTAANQGDTAETFTVTLYCNSTAIGTQAIAVNNGSSATLNFSWNTTGLPLGNYTITATASQVPGETDTTDNSLSSATQVSILGDINGDERVDMKDVSKVAAGFQTHPSDTKWTANGDIDENKTIDMKDISTIAKEFGKVA